MINSGFEELSEMLQLMNKYNVVVYCRNQAALSSYVLAIDAKKC